MAVADAWYAPPVTSYSDSGSYTVTGTGIAQASRYYDIPAGSAAPGMSCQFQAWGYGTQGGTSRQLNMYLQAFGINNCATNSMAPSAIPANAAFWWHYRALLMIVTAGSSGLAVITGTFTWSQQVATTTSNAATAALGQASLNMSTTADSAIGLNMAWSATGCSVTCDGSALMITNPGN